MRNNRHWSVLALAALTAAAIGAAMPAHADESALRVCADRANMPFSDASGAGFENKLAELVAHALGRSLAYTWLDSDEEDLPTALNGGKCDLAIGVPSQIETVDHTNPYYWSSYVYVTRADRHSDVTSIKDHRLRHMKIGVEAIGKIGAVTPPALAFTQSGLKHELVDFPIGDGPNGSRARIVDAVANGDIDIAAVWGPAAGYFAQHAAVPMHVAPIADTEEFSSRKTHFNLMVLQYDIAMGVRKGDIALRDRVDQILQNRKPEIAAVLKEYGVPLGDAALAARLTGPKIAAE